MALDMYNTDTICPKCKSGDVYTEQLGVGITPQLVCRCCGYRIQRYVYTGMPMIPTKSREKRDEPWYERCKVKVSKKKARWQMVCPVCKQDFEALAPNSNQCCSPECRKEYRKQYAKKKYEKHLSQVRRQARHKLAAASVTI